MIFAKRIILGILLLICHLTFCEAVSLDSLLNLPVMATPLINYSPETSWEFGAAAQGYFKCKGADKTSIVQLDGAYSLNKQWYVNTSGNLFFGQNSTWMLQYNAGFRNYPDYFFEKNNPIRYNSQRYLVKIQPQYCFYNDFSVGLNLQYINELTDFNQISFIGYGVVLQYDSRDVIYYPHRGIFLKTTATCHSAATIPVQNQNIAIVNLDFRHFVPIWNDLLFTYQVATEWAIGNDMPFQFLPTLGGQDLLRGVRRNQFRDKAMMAIQAELRFPIWSVLKGTVFCGVGDTYDYDNWQWKVPKVGYGIGLRACINKAKVNIRVDVARNNLETSWKTGWSYYLTATEAF